MVGLGILLVILAWLLWTPGGRYHRTYYEKTAVSWRAWNQARLLPYRDRWHAVYDQSYRYLLFLRDTTPSDAIIQLPPRQFIIDRSGGGIPLLASPSSTYSFLYPRVPVHYEDDSPFATRVNFVFAWEHWGMDRLLPDVPQTEENRFKVYAIERDAHAP